jgi:hypothetical protein
METTPNKFENCITSWINCINFKSFAVELVIMQGILAARFCGTLIIVSWNSEALWTSHLHSNIFPVSVEHLLTIWQNISVYGKTEAFAYIKCNFSWKISQDTALFHKLYQLVCSTAMLLSSSQSLRLTFATYEPIFPYQIKKVHYCL